jgi:hypothetical protein
MTYITESKSWLKVMESKLLFEFISKNIESKSWLKVMESKYDIEIYIQKYRFEI